MAKRKRYQVQLPKSSEREVEVKIVLKDAKDERERSTLYANHAQFSITKNEIFLDFYVLGPAPGEADNANATLIQRIAIPHNLAKGFATGLANLVAGYERDSGKKLSLGRTPDPDDTIKLWEAE